MTLPLTAVFASVASSRALSPVRTVSWTVVPPTLHGSVDVSQGS